MDTEIRCVIIDDEPLSIDALLWEIDGLPYPVTVMGKAHSGVDGLTLIKRHQPDLVFLDIEMPRMNGFDMLRNIGKIEFDVIFTTAYDQYALNAFRINAFDYLLKPVTSEDLKSAIEKYLQYRGSVKMTAKLESLFKVINNQNPSFPRVALPTLEGLEFVDASSVVRCEASSNYTYIHKEDGKKLLISRTMGDIEKMMAGRNFFRAHKSHLVNLLHVTRYVKGKGGYLVMMDGTNVPVSRTKKDELASML